VTSTPAASRVRHWVAAAVAVLLVAAAALLVVGILLERHTESGAEHPVVAATGQPQESHHDESTQGAHAEPGTAPGNRGGEAAERLTGISVESPWVVALGAIASVALAVAVWLRPNRPVIAIVVAFTAAALVLDVLEINHQIGADRIGLAALAGVIAALRVATIIGSGYLFRSRHPAAT
jgi:Flp pilus assembly protein TadB